MNNISRQFEVLVTKWKNDLFFRAEIKLAFWYSIGVLFFLSVLSFGIFFLFDSGFSAERDFEGREENDNYVEERFEEEANEHLLDVIIKVDIIFAVILVFLSFIIARKTIKPLREASVREKMFTADVAHEFRTPLTVIKTGTEVAIRKNDLEYFKKVSEDNLNEIDSLSALLNDLIFLIKNNSFKKTEKSNVLLSGLVERELNLLSEYAKTNEINITSEIQKDIFVFCNEEEVKRLVKNIIKNAIDYNKQGGRVEVYLNKTKNVSLKIKDTGIGISKEDQKYIFNRFFKSDNSRARVKSGSGLGLAIAKEIADENNISLTVSSTIGEGSIFELVFQ